MRASSRKWIFLALTVALIPACTPASNGQTRPKASASGLPLSRLGQPVESIIEGLPVPKASRLLSHEREPAGDPEGALSRTMEVAEYGLPPEFKVAVLEAWYLQHLSSNEMWRDWEPHPDNRDTESARNPSSPAGEAPMELGVDYAWTRSSTGECLHLRSTGGEEPSGEVKEKWDEANLGPSGPITIRIEKTNAYLCLQ